MKMAVRIKTNLWSNDNTIIELGYRKKRNQGDEVELLRPKN